ncbi:hypothetical protein [Marinifilum sp.]|uniref:hypothetical protein n=1 Tax=Marinifilum sp. TaxID=2033137 RepID=UPI003BAC4E71
MNILQSLEAYASAQKWVAINFMILGSILLILAGIFAFFVAKSPMASGMKWGSLAAGILIIAGGLSYLNFNEKTKQESTAIYQKDVAEFVQYEHERMEKVDKGFIWYQITFAAFVLAALIVIIFVKSPVLKGVAFSVAILFIGQLLIEGFSHKSIAEYTNVLRQEIKK